MELSHQSIAFVVVKNGEEEYIEAAFDTVAHAVTYIQVINKIYRHERINAEREVRISSYYGAPLPTPSHLSVGTALQAHNKRTSNPALKVDVWNYGVGFDEIPTDNKTES